MKHSNTGSKARLRAQGAKTTAAVPAVAPAPATAQKFENPQGVEILLAKRRKKMADEAVVLPPPDRTGMFGELRHPTISTIITGWIEITEAKAIDWLDHNKDNRKLNEKKVQGLARQHSNGDFVTTHQGIAFDDQDNLIDGQHTLKMVLLTGKPVMRMVTFGLPKKPAGKNFTTMDVIDAGARSVADQLMVSHGITESGPKKQICMALASICYGMRTRNLSEGQVLDVLKEFEPGIEFVIANRAKQPGLRQVGVLAGFAFALSAGSAHSGFIKTLFAQLNRGDGQNTLQEYEKLRNAQKPLRPIEHLRHFLTGPESALFSKSMNRCIADVTLQVIYAEVHKAKTTELEQSDIGLKWFAEKQKTSVDKIARLFRLPDKSR